MAALSCIVLQKQCQKLWDTLILAGKLLSSLCLGLKQQVKALRILPQSLLSVTCLPTTGASFLPDDPLLLPNPVFFLCTKIQDIKAKCHMKLPCSE